MADTNLNYTLTLKDLFSKKLGGAESQVKRLDGNMNKLNRSVNRVGTAIGAYFSGRAIANFGMAVVDSLKNYEYFSASLRTLLHRDKVAASALQGQLVQLAKVTPFSLVDVQSASKQLLAYGFKAGDVVRQMRLLGDVSSATGNSIGDVAYLYGTLRTQGKAMTKDLYQFTNRGINILPILAKNLKTTEGNIYNFAAAGKIGFKDVEKAFIEMTSKGGDFYNMMEEQSKTTGGKISNMGDVWEQVRIKIGRSQTGIISGTVNFVFEMANKIDKYLSQSLFREEATKNIASGFKINEHFKTGDDLRDRQFRAKSGSDVRTFESAHERSLFLNENKQFSKERDIGTMVRFQIFSDKIEQLTTGATEKNAGPLMKLLKKEREANLKLLKQEQISGKLAANQDAVLVFAIEKMRGILKLAGAGNGSGKGNNGGNGADDNSGTTITAARPQSLNITINDGIGNNMTIQTTNLQESASKIKEAVAKALLEAVNDVNNIAK